MVYAVDINPSNFAPSKFQDLASLLNLIIPLMMSGIALIFLGMLLMGAFQWLTAGDSAENVKKSQAVIVHAVLGLIIVVISYVAVQIIGVVLNLGKLPF